MRKDLEDFKMDLLQGLKLDYCNTIGSNEASTSHTFTSRKNRAEVKQLTQDDQDIHEIWGLAQETSLKFDTSESTTAEIACKKEKDKEKRRTGPTRRSTKGKWTAEEDERLTNAVSLHNGQNWKKIAESFPGRTHVNCLHRWQKVLNPELVKGPWTKEEDGIIIKFVEKHGSKKWSTIAKSLKGRIGKQCRERWHNHLNPTIKKEPWTMTEETILIEAHQKYGNKWAELAKLLPGRADNSIKNHWNCVLKKRLNLYPGYQTPYQSHGVLTVDVNNSTSQVRCLQSVSPGGLNLNLEHKDGVSSEVHGHQSFNEETIGSSTSSLRDGLSRSTDLAVGDTSSKFNDTASSNSRACDSSDINRGEGDNQFPATPLHCDNGNSFLLFFVTTLKERSKGFETSMIRKRARQSSDSVFQESSHKESCGADSDYLIRSKREKRTLEIADVPQNGNKGQFLNRTDDLGVTRRGVARRLDNEFDIGLGGSSDAV